MLPRARIGSAPASPIPTTIPRCLLAPGPWHYLLPRAGRDPNTASLDCEEAQKPPQLHCPGSAAPTPLLGLRAHGAAGTGTRDIGSAWDSHPAQPAALSERTDKYTRGRAEKPESAPLRLRLRRCPRPVARPLPGAAPGWHGTEQMVRAAWPAAAASSGSWLHMMLTEATWASRGPGRTPRHRGQSRSSCWRGRGSTERVPKSPCPSQHHHLLWRILRPLRCEQQTGVAVGRIWQGKTALSKAGWQWDHSTSGKSSKASITQ